MMTKVLINEHLVDEKTQAYHTMIVVMYLVTVYMNILEHTTIIFLLPNHILKDF